MSDSLTTALRRNLSSAIRARRFDDAGRILDELRNADPVSAATRCLELELAFESGSMAEARVLAPKVVGLYPDSARAQFLAGRVEAKQRRWSQALVHFEESNKLVPHWRSSWWIAKTLTQLGEFDRAEALLVELTPRHPCCGCDLAWLYERKEQIDLALEALGEFLTAFPKHEWARKKQRQLHARQLDPTDLVRELDELRELGEEIEDELVPTYVESLLKSARGADARAFIDERADRLPDRVIIQTAWNCYRLQMYDLALTLFVRGFDYSMQKASFRRALEKAARLAGRIDEVRDLYLSRVNESPWLWGRIKALPRPQDGD